MYTYGKIVLVVNAPDTATNVMLSSAKRAMKRKLKQPLPGGSTHPRETWPLIVPSRAMMGQTRRLCWGSTREHRLVSSILNQVGSIEVHNLLLNFVATPDISSDM
jgi:hypothetical protein